MIEIVNNQRKIKFDRQIFQEFAEAAIDKIPEASTKSLTVAFVSDRKMRELNKKFRGKNSTTDVLSFPFEADVLSVPSAVADGSAADSSDADLQPRATACGTDKTAAIADFEADALSEPGAVATGFFLGDIVISAEQAARQSVENNLSFELEIKQLILHGILHLCGYDHETDAGEMNALELELRKSLRI